MTQELVIDLCELLLAHVNRNNWRIAIEKKFVAANEKRNNLEIQTLTKKN